MAMLGPHLVHYTDDHGVERDITVTLDIGYDYPVTLPSGTVIQQRLGRVEIRSDIYNWSMDAQGADDIQVVTRLIWMSGIELQAFSRQESVEIYQYSELEVKDEFDLFK